MSATWFIELNQAAADVHTVSAYLTETANALQVTGNDHLSARLTEMAYILANASKSIHDTASRKVIADYAAADATSATMVKAALAGAATATERTTATMPEAGAVAEAGE